MIINGECTEKKAGSIRPILPFNSEGILLLLELSPHRSQTYKAGAEKQKRAGDRD
jgi:hypothetical protein